MATAHDVHLEQGRALARIAAQWLVLIRFRAHGGAPVFSPSVSRYHDMLNPKAGDEARSEACRAMLALVCEQVLREDMIGRETYAQERPVDPYRQHWQTTERGACLTAISSLLARAIRGFEHAGTQAS